MGVLYMLINCLYNVFERWGPMKSFLHLMRSDDLIYHVEEVIFHLGNNEEPIWSIKEIIIPCKKTRGTRLANLRFVFLHLRRHEELIWPLDEVISPSGGK